MDIILTFSDEGKIKCLENSNEFSRNIIIETINSLSTDDLRIEGLRFLKNNMDKSYIISNLQSDESKVKCLPIIKEDRYGMLDIVRNLSSDELKIQCLNLFDTSFISTSLTSKADKNANDKLNPPQIPSISITSPIKKI